MEIRVRRKCKGRWAAKTNLFHRVLPDEKGAEWYFLANSFFWEIINRSLPKV